MTIAMIDEPTSFDVEDYRRHLAAMRELAEDVEGRDQLIRRAEELLARMKAPPEASEAIRAVIDSEVARRGSSGAPE